MSQAPVIAIVDDDEAVRVATSCLLRSAGYAAQIYASAIEYLNVSAATAPACLITDVQMPGMGGIKLHQSLIAAGRRLPVIFVTAFPTDALRDQALAAGASAFLHKPCDGDTMIRSVQKALGH